MIKLYTVNGAEKFQEVKKVPEVGDYWPDLGGEVVGVEPVRLDDMQNSRAILGYTERIYKAHRVLFINRGCDEEREDPAEDYIVTISDIEPEEEAE